MLVALLLSATFLVQGTWALAGTTGGLSGTVTDTDTGAPVANAKVTASSPSQTVSLQTDNGGHFLFISLIPDTYTVSIEKDGYDTSSQSGLSIFADAVQNYGFKLHKALKTIAQVTSRSTGSLVKPGQTADVYSVNATTQDKVSALGGGGSLNSAYSAIASVPGAFVPLNQTGYFQTVHIRGGDYDQVGYELDGVPVNRAFDNYPSGAASSLGQQELQVYTGATPANSEGQGLAGYINQVIRTGTFPGFGLITGGVGAPVYYHKLAAEVGGATPNRNFSYYVGVGGYNQEFRYVNNDNGAGFTNLGPPAALTPCPATPDINNAACYASGVGPGGYVLYPYQFGILSSIADRDTVVNLHIGLPHKYDGLRDDVQILWDSGYLLNSYYSSTNDTGGAAQLPGSTGPHLWSDSFQWNGAVGAPLPTNYQSLVSTYFYPSSPSHAVGDPIPADYRDNTRNTQEVVKIQYQKNFNPNAYARLYGYTYYSDWLQNGPNSAFYNFIGSGASPDYELSSHTRGASLQIVDQISEKHLLSALASYTTSSTLRDNNTQMFNSGGRRARGTVLVDASNPFNGVCYNAAGTATTCDVTAPGGVRASFLTWATLQGGGGITGTVPCTAPGGACQYYVMENSLYATYNTVKPEFSAFSLTDQFRPSEKLLLNIGVREDSFKFNGSSTRPNDPARQFWFNAFNLDKCIDNTTGAPVDKIAGGLTTLPTDPCPAGFSAAAMVNESAQVLKYNSFQPRLGATYTINPDTVLRASFGKYVEPPNSAFEQYNTLQENLPAFLGTAFYKFGFTTPGHTVRPPTSYNADLSLEKHIRGTDWSYKLTPFLRKTKDQIQQFFLDQASGFVSGLNVGRQTSEGVELQINKGDFSRDGLSGQLAFTYTNSFIKYDTLQNGTSIVAGMNSDIATYNSFTQAGGGAPCYTSAGAPDAACAAGSIANPYFNDSPKALLDPKADYPTYDLFPGPIGSSAQTFGAPYVATLILNYKHDKWAITPSLQLQAGARYGAPETTPGIDPTSGCTPLPSGSTTGDPRYPYGAPGGSPFDATSCGGTITIPNPFTKNFDNLGSFRQPSQLLGNVQVRYDASPKVTLVGTFAGVLNSCFGGTKAAWTLDDHNVCSYGILNNAGAFPPVGNVYNPGATFQRLVQFPYAPYLGAVNVDGNSTKTPFNFFLEARIKM